MSAARDYRPPHRKQEGTGPCEWQNCNCATHSMMVDTDWLGARTLGVRAIREYIRDRYVDGCVGTSMTQNRMAVKDLADTDLTYRWDVPFTQVLNALDAHRPVAALEDYTYWHNTPWDEAPGFNGFHAVFYLDRRYNDGLNRWEVLRFDPLAEKPYWVPQKLVENTMRDALSTYNVEFQFGRSLRASAPKKVLYGKDSRGKSPVVRSRPGGGIRLGTIGRGALCSHDGFVNGAETFVNSVADDKWLKVTKINDQPVSERYPGREFVYIARGWFRGPTGAV